MSHDPDAAYRCQKCGATSALLMPQPVTHSNARDREVPRVRPYPAVPRHLLEGAGGPLDSNGSLE